MFLSVAVPVATLPLLTYRLPPDWPMPARGARVLVPLGTRTVTGIVIGQADGAPPDRVRDVVEVLDDKAFLPPEVVDLALWISDYYMAAPGHAIGATAPPFAWRESERHYELTPAGQAAVSAGGGPAVLVALAKGPKAQRQLTRGAGGAATAAALRQAERDGFARRVQALAGARSGFRTETFAALTPAGLSTAQALAGDAPAPAVREKARAALLALAETAGEQAVRTLKARGLDVPTLKRLAARGLVHLREQRVDRDPFGAAAAMDVVRDELRPLTSEQEAAFETVTAMVDARTFRPVLVHGVTGSGKTELYVRLARHTILGHRRVLILVPEIALTPQMAAQFRAAFGDRVAIQHSGLSDGERHDQWHRIREGQVDLVVGTRSAVFSPIGDLGLVVVDEEHDTSYKQDETPRYHGRDVAVMRARSAGAVVLLGSATPGLETYHNAETGRYAKVVLSRRVMDRPLADVSIVDMREEYAAAGPDVILSRALREAVGRRLAAGEQSLLLLNRRGYSTAVFCRQCGQMLDCPNCSVSLTVHHRGSSAPRAVCHYCNYSLRVPSACTKCAGPYLEQSGFGTERVEGEVERLFPGVRVGRVDRDTMQKRGAVAEVLSRFGRRELDVLVGTQMIAKGHDFANVTLVGVVSADMGLGMADFRASERTFQLLTQVVGRAGRGTRPGAAIVQTLNPDHYSIRLACRQDYVAFYEQELKYRGAMRYPPAVGLLNIVVRAPSLGQALADASDVVARLPASHGALVLGPAPAPLARLRGESRAQVFLKSRHRTAMRQAVAAALASLPDLARRVTVDVDPIGML